MIVAARNIQSEYFFHMPFIRFLNKLKKNEIANFISSDYYTSKLNSNGTDSMMFFFFFVSVGGN